MRFAIGNWQLAICNLRLAIRPSWLWLLFRENGAWRSFLLLALALTLSPTSAHAAVSWTNSGPGFFFVATNGNDQWSGSRPCANLGKTDGPFATLPRALQAAREYRKQIGGSSNAPAGIFLRGGLYILTEPLVIKPEDSNLVLAGYST